MWDDVVGHAVGERSKLGVAAALILIPGKARVEESVRLSGRGGEGDPVVSQERLDAVACEPVPDGALALW